jgi:hypothetical protein
VPLLERQGTRGETGETGEEFDLFAGSAGFIREELIRWRQWGSRFVDYRTRKAQ